MRDYTKFYTPQYLSEFLVDQCGDIAPSNIIDICAGSWNLLNAAGRKWPEATIKGVDVDTRSSLSVLSDGRLYAEESVLRGDYYDLVLANPPFQYETPNANIVNILTSRIGKFNGYVHSRLEATMLLFNSLLVKPGGVLASIVPDGIMSSERLKEVRAYLSEEFHVEKIIKLPNDAFGSGEIHTSIIILRKTRDKRPTEFIELKEVGTTSSAVRKEIPYWSIRSGRWVNDICITTASIINRQFDLYRNSISSSELTLRQSGTPVIHSSSISEQEGIVRSGLRYLRQGVSRGHFVYTRPGDIVIVRVGRMCGTCAEITEQESNFLTSDCILLIRPSNNEQRHKIILRLSSEISRQLAKGVAARFITKRDLENLLSGELIS